MNQNILGMKYNMNKLNIKFGDLNSFYHGFILNTNVIRLDKVSNNGIYYSEEYSFALCSRLIKRFSICCYVFDPTKSLYVKFQGIKYISIRGTVTV